MRMLFSMILVLVAVLSPPPLHAGEAVMRAGANELRLHDSPCTHGATLLHIAPEWRDKFKKAMAKVNGAIVYACWIAHEETLVYVMFENGEPGMWPLAQFRDEPGA